MYYSTVKSTLAFLILAFSVGTLLIRAGTLALIASRLLRVVRARKLRNIWGIRNGERIRIVCSELPVDTNETVTRAFVHHPRQYPEDRQFVYLSKYGDVDAFFEVVSNLIVLYPDSEIRIMSSAEQALSDTAGDYHLVLIGGPDYNQIVLSEIEAGRSRIRYIDPDSKDLREAEGESALYDTVTKRRHHCSRHPKYPSIDDDVGFMERYSSTGSGGRYWTILIGGPNTVGVTAAAKAFGAFRAEGADASLTVKLNAIRVSQLLRRATWLRLRRLKRLLVFVSARKEHSSVKTPLVEPTDVFVETE